MMVTPGTPHARSIANGYGSWRLAFSRPGKLRIARSGRGGQICRVREQAESENMSQTSVWTRREVWTRKLLYPGHTFPTAIAPVLVGIALAWHDGVFAAVPALLAFLAGWQLRQPAARTGRP